MAFVQKEGSSYVVRQGNTGKLLSRHTKRADAITRMKALHRENKPKASSRGKTAQKRFKKKK